ncbi:MAG: Ig-like domain-containing protein [bacterium]
MRVTPILIVLLVVIATGASAQTAPPVLDPIGAPSGDENVNLNFVVTTSDADATTPSLRTSTLPGVATFVDNLDGTGTFDWTPTYNDAGAYQVTFYADDAVTADTDSEVVTITVNNVNQLPVLAAIGAQSVDENVNLNFVVTSSDPDLDFPVLTTSTLPTGATFNALPDGTGTFDWTPDFTQSGSYDITFYATDGSFPSDVDSEVVTITVNNVNQLPVLAAIGAQSVDENVNLNFGVTSSDPDLDFPVLTTSTLPTGATFNALPDGTGTFDWTPDFTQSGSYDITFYATDGSFPSDVDSEVVTITVNNVNQLPVLAAIGAQSVDENVNLNFVVTSSDADGDFPVLTTSTLPTGATFNALPDGTGTFDWTPVHIDAGVYNVTFYATDGSFPTVVDSEIVTITVYGAPVVSDIPNATIAEGGSFATISLDDFVDDPDNLDSEISWTYSGNTELSVLIVDRVATISIPDADWNGSETITFTATDPGLLSDSDPALFTVSAVNDAPVLSDIPDQTIAEGAAFTTISLDDFVSDIDNVDAAMTWSYSGNSELTVDITARVATISIPTLDWNGSETITFTATDPELLSDSDASTFTVTAVNDAPVVADIPDQTVAEGSTFTTISLDDYVADVDNADTEISWTYSGNSDLTVSIVSRVATISIPDINWNGSEAITFRATDPGLLFGEDAATFMVTVVNDAPVVIDIPNQTIVEGDVFTTINLNGYVSDVDHTDAQMVWTFSGNTELTVDITAQIATITLPNADWNGSETITFRATDPGLLFDEDAATFSVTGVNDAPVVSDIPDQTVPEGATFATINLDDYVADVDNADSEITWTKNGNSQLLVDITNRVATVIIPNSEWNGSETITFTATDPYLLTAADAATFTVTVGNDPPVVSGIPDQTVMEGASFTSINLDDYVSDLDNADSEMTWTYSGNSELTVDITDRIATITMPDADWYGAETITFIATDPGLLSDSDPALFTVTNINDGPVVSDIPDQVVAEGDTFATISLDDFVADVDDLDNALTWTYSGNADLGVTIDGSRVATIVIPDVDWNGTETITFTATDTGLLSDFNAATFTVTAVNDAPVIADIPDQVVLEGSLFATVNLDDYVNDIDNADSEISWSYSGNSELTVAIDISRVATITIPSSEWNGSELITFTATDPGLLNDSDGATFTVSAVNDAPVVTDIPDQSVAEGASFVSVNLDDYVSDIDNTDSEISWSYSGNVELTVDITARVATITIPDADWNGSELITFTATDPGLLSDSDPATFTVTGVNDGPLVADIPDQTIGEGDPFATINLDDYVSDIDNVDSDISWSYSGNTELTVVIDIGRVATITTPSPDWNGAETITFTATDPGLLSDNDGATFTVNTINDAPVVSGIPDQTISEGATFATINLDAYVTDIDNSDAEISWTYSGNTELSVAIVDRVATIGIPDADWNGSELITFTATDPSLSSNSDAATFTVSAVNDAPVVADIPDQTVGEGASFVTINLDNYISDVDNLASDMSWSYGGNVELSVSIVNRVAIVSTPDVNWTGTEVVVFTATDPGLLSSFDAVQFTVTATNDAPVLADIPDQTIAEGAAFATINLDDYVSDVDNLALEMTWSYVGNSALTVLLDVNRVATIGIPSPDWNGVETITFRVTDPGLLHDEDGATFRVTSVNDAPVVADIPDQTIGEGSSFATINLDDYVTDIDNSDAEIAWTYSGNTELTVTINGSRVATIGVPTSEWSGSETVTFTATDPGLLSDFNDASFTVTTINDAPIVTDIPNQTVDEGSTFATINLDDYVSDIDNLDSELSWSYSGNTALAVDITAHVATVTIPDIDWNGTETITFTATDPGLASGFNAAVFTVTSVNDGPVVADIPDQTIAEGSTFATINLDDFVSDVDNADTQISWVYSGNTELTVSIGVGRVATITIPSPDWNGAETITFTATDPGLLSDNDGATFTVTAGNDAPVVADIPNQTVAEGAAFTTINLDNFVTDVDNSDAEITWSYSGNTELTVSIVDRVATVGIPDVNWNGSELITFTATDPGLLSNSNQATFTVTAINDAPIVSDIPAQTIAEGAAFTIINLDDYVTDVDNLASQMSWTYSGNIDLSVAIVDRVATITTPDGNWTGSEVIVFTATDPGLLSAFDAAQFTVTATNDAPVVVGIPDQTIAEGATFATVSLDNYVSDVDNLDAEMTWTWTGNAELTVSLDVGRVATITIPSPDWNGTETITFTATDPGLLSDNDSATFTVSAVNDAPVVADIPDQTISEGSSFATISLDDYVSDIDNADSEINWTYSGNIELSVAIVDRVATINIPDADWNGAETITFTATDPGSLSDNNAAAFTVSPSNDAPVVADIPDQTIAEGSTFATINLDDYVSDIDNSDAEMTWSYSGNTDLGVTIDGSRVATIVIPDINWNGAETITFTATDPGLLSDFNDASFTVTTINDEPVLATIGAHSTDENVNLTFGVSASDADGDIPELTTSLLPGSAGFVDNLDGTGTFDWTPTYSDSGSYQITFYAIDGVFPSSIDSEIVTITVSNINRAPVADAGLDQIGVPVGPSVTLDGSASFDPDTDPITYSWVQVGGLGVTLSDATDPMPTFSSALAGTYVFELTVHDGTLGSVPDTVSINMVNAAPPAAIADLSIQINGDALEFSWSAITVDTDGFSTTVDRYVIYRGTQAYFTPGPADSIGFTDNATTSFVDFDIGGANVVGDAANQYFYTVEVVDIYGGRSAPANRVGEFDYPLVTTSTTDYNLIGIPFENTGITNADGLIAAIGSGNVATVNNFIPTSQSFEARFAAGFGTNFTVVVGGIYQVNATAASTLSLAGNVPSPGAVSYPIVTTASTDYNFLMIPFEREGDFATAQEVLDSMTGVLNTLNNFVASSQSYQSRFAAGFGNNFTVRAGIPYQGNAASAGIFPGL